MQDNSTDDTELDLSALITELGMDKLSPKAREMALAHALNAVNFRVLTRIMNTMTEEEREHMRTIAQVTPDKVQATLLSRLPQDEQARMYQEEIEAVKNEMKGKLAR